MTDYRRLEPSERLQWGDEIWTDVSTTNEPSWQWLAVNTPARGLAYCGKLVGGCIVRRPVELMNRDPTADEMAAAHRPWRDIP